MKKKKLRIAQVAPLWTQIPPSKYGGIELIVYHLAERMMKKGHDVTLFAAGDSKTSAKLVSVTKDSLLKQGIPWKFQYYDIYNITEALKMAMAKKFDIVHTHLDLTEIFFSQFFPVPVLHTIHNPLYITNVKKPTAKHRLLLLKKFRDNNYIAISKSQKKLCPYRLNFLKVIYNGMEVKNFKFNPKSGDYFLWTARIDKYKGIENAIEIAEKTGIKLVLAGRLEEFNKEYFKEKIKPRLGKNIKFIGEYSKNEKSKIFGGAKALLYPILWHEPFGLVMTEAMACGTPVIAFDRGSVSEVVKDGKTGFVVNTVPQAVKAVEKIDTIKREDCRRWVEDKFSVEKMVDEYERVYYKLLKKSR
jgi:glycosyltransferase involved in cell wall biosynthesis